LIKLLPYILFEKYIYILAVGMTSQGTSTVAIVSAHFFMRSKKRPCRKREAITEKRQNANEVSAVYSDAAG